MSWHDLLPYVVFAVTFVASILSGMTGGGGGFIITPLLIAVGLTPQQAIATGKMGALSLDVGAIAAFRHRKQSHKTLTLILVIISIIVGIVSSVAIRRITGDNLKLAMGILNFCMVPLLFIRHHSLKSRRLHFFFQGIGLLIITVIKLMIGIFSSGVGSLINVMLIIFFGVSALDANLIKRTGSLATDIFVLAGLIGSGLINLEFGLICAATALFGGYIGAKFMLHEGERFARYALMVLMVVSGIWLIVTANT